MLKGFINLYFDSNPISQIGLIITRRKRVEKISELAGNPRSHIALLEQLKYQECEGETSIQNALDMGLQTLKYFFCQSIESGFIVVDIDLSVFRHMPKYSSREMLFILGSLTTCDPGNILQTIKVRIRCIYGACVYFFDIHLLDM
jgi:transcription initiation factor TFIIH subunit 2